MGKTIAFLVMIVMWMMLGHGIIARATAAAVETKKSDWHGYEKESFSIAGHAAYVVVPHISAPGNPWVWRTSFPDFHSEVDLELVRAGYHIGYIEILDMLGCDDALDIVDQFYGQVRSQWGLSEKMAIEPCSRGGLPAYRYAARRPERVACIYGDVPVMDFKSWPLRRPDHAVEWAKILKDYGFKNDAEAMAYGGNPLDELEPIAKAKIPIRHVICLTDHVVPPEQNTLEAKRRLEKLGSDIEVVTVKESNDMEGHHFPMPEVDISVRFVMDHTDVQPRGHEYYKLRDGLENCRSRFETEKVGRVAFLGGSITAMSGWREELERYLQKRFPETKFDFINAGIGSEGSVPDAFRLERDVLSHGPIDLLFVDTAVNDGTNIPQEPDLMLRGMEGIVRHVRMANPKTDIVVMNFVMQEYVYDYNAGKIPAAIAQNGKVADAYGCVSLNLAEEVTDRIGAGEFSWSDFGSEHPSPYGQRLYANSMMRMLDAAWAVKPSGVKDHAAVETALDAGSFFKGRLGSLESAKLLKGFVLAPDWKPVVAADVREGYVHVPALAGTEAGSEFQFEFDGTGAGLMIGAGPDAGIIEFSIDGGAPKKIDTFTKWSDHLYIPWAVMLDDKLKSGHHTVRVKLAPEHNPASVGTALYVFGLLLN